MGGTITSMPIYGLNRPGYREVKVQMLLDGTYNNVMQGTNYPFNHFYVLSIQKVLQSK